MTASDRDSSADLSAAETGADSSAVGASTAGVDGGALTDGDAVTWKDERRTAAFAHAAALERVQQAEHASARALIADFVAEARRSGLPTERLMARSYDGRHRYRTSTSGWYLRRDRNAAIGDDGLFYVLSVPSSLGAMLRGATLEPKDPPMVLGAGGKDGESVDLPIALQRALDRAIDG